MSETQKSAGAKPAKKKVVKKKATVTAEPRIEEEARALPKGHETFFVAIPGKVSRGGGLGKAEAGEKMSAPTVTVDTLELRGFGFRDENQAKAAFTMHQRREEKRIADMLNADRQRRERRERLRAEEIRNATPEWRG